MRTYESFNELNGASITVVICELNLYVGEILSFSLLLCRSTGLRYMFQTFQFQITVCGQSTQVQLSQCLRSLPPSLCVFMIDQTWKGMLKGWLSTLSGRKNVASYELKWNRTNIQQTAVKICNIKQLFESIVTNTVVIVIITANCLNFSSVAWISQPERGIFLIIATPGECTV